MRVRGSAGRALQSHCRGQGFESPQIHQKETTPVEKTGVVLFSITARCRFLLAGFPDETRSLRRMHTRKDPKYARIYDAILIDLQTFNRRPATCRETPQSGSVGRPLEMLRPVLGARIEQ